MTTAPATPKLLLTSAEAARALSVSPKTLWNLRQRGEIRAVEFGVGERKSVRYRLSDLELFAERAAVKR